MTYPRDAMFYGLKHYQIAYAIPPSPNSRKSKQSALHQGISETEFLLLFNVFSELYFSRCCYECQAFFHAEHPQLSRPNCSLDMLLIENVYDYAGGRIARTTRPAQSTTDLWCQKEATQNAIPLRDIQKLYGSCHDMYRLSSLRVLAAIIIYSRRYICFIALQSKLTLQYIIFIRLKKILHKSYLFSFKSTVYTFSTFKINRSALKSVQNLLQSSNIKTAVMINRS